MIAFIIHNDNINDRCYKSLPIYAKQFFFAEIFIDYLFFEHGVIVSGVDLGEIFRVDVLEDLNSTVIVKTNRKAVENLFQVLVLVYQLAILKKGYKTALADHGWVSKLVGRSHFHHNSNHIANFVPHSLLQQLTTFLDESVFFVCDALFETDGMGQFIVGNCNAKSNGRGVSDLFERFICIFQYFKLKIVCSLNDWPPEHCSAVPETSFNDIWTGYFDIFWPFN